MHDDPSTDTRTGRVAPLLYPYPIAIFPILSLYAEHTDVTLARDMLAPALLMIAFTTLLLVLQIPLFPDRHKRALTTVIALALFWVYGAAADTTRDLLRFNTALAPKHLALIATLGLLLALYPLYRLRKTTRSFRGLTSFLSAVSIIAITIAGANAGYKTFVNALASDTAELPDDGLTPAANADPGRYPDIYFLVLDAYGRNDVIDRVFGHDNTDFWNALQERGFYIADRSFANYNQTRFSISSSLNMNYVNGVATELGGSTTPSALVKNNKLVQYLKERGYAFFSFHTEYGVTQVPSADTYLSPPVTISEFQAALINMTPLRSLLNLVRSRKMEQHGQRSLLFDIHRDLVLFVFDQLKILDRSEQPKFVFAHVVCPHWPFVFDENLNHVYPDIRYNLAADFPSWDPPEREEFVAGYAKQVQAVNTLVLQAVDAIQARDPAAVLIVQGDHGPRLTYATRSGEDWDAHLVEELAILNAMHLPGGDETHTPYPTMSPVNTFRVVLNRYFDQDLPMLPDRSYIYDESTLTLHEVTDRLTATGAKVAD